MHIIFTQPVPSFSTPFSVFAPFGLTALAKATLGGQVLIFELFYDIDELLPEVK